MGWKRVLTELEVRKLFIHCFYSDGGMGGFFGRYGGLCPDNVITACNSEFRVPDDFVTNGTLKAVIVPNGSGDVRFQLAVWFAQDNEGAQTHMIVNAMGVETVVIGQIEVLSTLPIALTNLAVGDYVASWFNRGAQDPLDTVNASIVFLGFLFEYD